MFFELSAEQQEKNKLELEEVFKKLYLIQKAYGYVAAGVPHMNPREYAGWGRDALRTECSKQLSRRDELKAGLSEDEVNQIAEKARSVLEYQDVRSAPMF